MGHSHSQTLVSATELENLSNDPDSTCRRFYHKSLEDIMELSYYVT